MEKKYLLPLIIIFILIAYQLVRVIAFANVYGGVEHDSGWFLSVARSLAERGTYTTLVSTIVDPQVRGDINVDQKFDIQDSQGRIWFFTGNGNGPVSILANALVLKIFGTGFWALRAGPLIFYTLFLVVAAYILYRLAGLGAVLLFHAYLFFYPHLSIFLSYEAMGEVYSIFFILLSYLVFGAALQRKTRRLRYFFLAGLVVGLTLNTKLITLMSVSGIFAWAGLLWVSGFGFRVSGFRSQVAGRRSVDDKVGHATRNTQHALRPTSHVPRVTLIELLALGIGAPLTLALWELVHWVILTRLAGFEMYVRHLQQRIKFILDDGSGVGLQIHSGPEFFWDKFFLLSEAAHPQRWVTALIFAAIFLGGLYLLWLWRARPGKQNLVAVMWLGWLANTAWFAGIAKTGWPRHFWFGLLLAVMLLCVISVNLLKLGRWGDKAREIGRLRDSSLVTRHLSRFTILRPSSFVLRPLSLMIGGFLLFLIVWGFTRQPHVWGFFLPDEIVPYWQQKQINNKYGASLPWILIPRAAQAEVVEYIKQMPPEARVYYPAGHKSAEIPPQTGRLHYPLQRRDYVTPHPADIALIGPSITSPWNDPIRRRDLLELVERQCPHPALQNDYYLICPIVDNLPQQ